jgi:hypothetical protein
MELFYSTQVSIPITQIVLLLSISTLALLFGRLKLALLVNYLFTLYWGYLSNQGIMTESQPYIFVYFGFGFTVIILAMIGFLTASD